ncbi:hypothetical protein [Taibaiella soli]|uniref:Cytochrome oxidase subunit I profile domain-containing protein n=1 Tax=Taibaiella soli TaxID=1649169 RepID=A0A2W2B3Z1_9BACT|nr:hypothetical protein [Taibaiella soli]PZF74758.1 hypothetical protein DN068_00750 [Taibaiella soli]
MINQRNKWLAVAIFNLLVVALLGLTLRSKILFSIPGIDFGNLLQAHSHFAFGGWITLCLFILMVYEILPAEKARRKIYQWLLFGTAFSATGMLFSFPFQGYGAVSICCSTLFIFVSYIFSWCFARDVLKTERGDGVILLSITAVICFAISSVGPFTLAYILATHKAGMSLYKDSVYTYLHFQYNGFFTLAVVALFINYFRLQFSEHTKKQFRRFVIVLTLSVAPTLFLSFLWHPANTIIRLIAYLGCVLLAATLVFFFKAFNTIKKNGLSITNPVAKVVGIISWIAFALKTAVQIGIAVPAIGHAVFGDRPIIIGYLHLVMLGFLTLFLLFYLMNLGFFSGSKTFKAGIIIFSAAVIANEVFLMAQGLTAMIMIGSTIYPLLLWFAAIGLTTGAALIALPALKNFKSKLQARN